MKEDQSSHAYWRATLGLLGRILVIWFLVSFGAGILFADLLNNIQLGGYPLGFWFAQQGSIYIFIALIFYYGKKMGEIDRRFVPPAPETERVVLLHRPRGLGEEQLVGVFGDFVGQTHQQAPALRGGDVLPHRVKTVTRCGHGVVNVARIATLNLVKHLAV